LVLGENIGTTVTALLASLGTSTTARRAAYFHSTFNVIGVIWVTEIFGFFLMFVNFLVGIDNAETASTTQIAAAIATGHSTFNIVNTIVFLPLVPWMVKLLELVVPNKEFKEKPKLTSLDMRYLDTPALAIEQSRNEVHKMGDGCEKMLNWLAEIRDQDSPDAKLGNRLKHREQVFDSVQDEVSAYVTDLLAKALPHNLAEEARRQITMADDYESFSDLFVDLDKYDRKLRRDGLRFSPNQREQLNYLNGLVLEYLRAVNSGVSRTDPNILRDTETISKKTKSAIKQLRKQHLEDISGGQIHPQVSVAYLAALNAYARVREHLENIAEAVIF
jgi:phosphate:Na+ symporter